MKPIHKVLLMIDGIVNIILGAFLLLYPVGIIKILGLPSTNTHFYPSILGAVLLGIGLALFLDLFGYAKKIRGLGLGGAIAINLIGSIVLICWMIFGALAIPLKGQIILWLIAGVVFSIGITELVTKSYNYEN